MADAMHDLQRIARFLEVCGRERDAATVLAAIDAIRWDDYSSLSHAAGQEAETPKRGEATGDTTTFSDAWARLTPIDRAVITTYFERHWTAVARSEGDEL